MLLEDPTEDMSEEAAANPNPRDSSSFREKLTFKSSFSNRFFCWESESMDEAAAAEFGFFTKLLLLGGLKFISG